MTSFSPIGAHSDNLSVETPIFVADDCCLIDDPSEEEAELGELDAEEHTKQSITASSSKIGSRLPKATHLMWRDLSAPGEGRGSIGSLQPGQ